ncbi:MAG: hypothetical protein Q7J05_01760 [Paludibacter sp.]|nr:hypothetical protein [Paludibacter sp.]
MNNNKLISFLALAVILIVVYSVISMFYGTSEEKSYNITAYAPPVSLKHIKSSRPRVVNTTSSYQSEGVNMQAQSTSAVLQNSASKPGVEVGSKTISYNKPSNQVTVGSQQSGFSAYSGVGVTRKPLPRASVGSFTSSMPLGISGRTTLNQQSTATSSGSLAFNGSKYSAPSYEPFSGGGPGIPDPGGFFNDSDDEDIVFIPVPDGLLYLIFLSILYAMFKLVVVKRNLQLSFIRNLFAKSLRLPFIKN